MRQHREAGWSDSLLVIALLTSYAIPVYAQEPQQTPGQSLQEVVVTATRKEESLSKVPISIAAFTADEMDKLGVTSIDDIGSLSPGLNFERRQAGGGANTSITIRGINSQTGAATTGVYIDDTPIQMRHYGNAFSSQNDYPDIFDLERVEVLRGPQGTLFGEGSMGGVVRFITTPPSLTAYSSYVRADSAYTENGSPSWALGAAGGGPIIEDTLGFRVSAYVNYDGGWIDRIAQSLLAEQYQLGPNAPMGPTERNSNWSQSASFRAALLAKVGDNFTINPSINYQTNFQNSQSQFWTFFSDPDSGHYVNAAPFDEPHKDWTWLTALKMTYAFPAAELISNTSYYKGFEYNQYDQTFEGIAYTPAGPPPGFGPLYQLPGDPTYTYKSTDPDSRESLTQELRLQSTGDGRLTWTIGAFYSELHLLAQDFGATSPGDDDALARAFGYANAYALFGAPLLNLSSIYPGPGTGGQNSNYTVYEKTYDRQLAGYGQLTYKVFDKLAVILGVRVTDQYFYGTSLSGGQYAGTSSVTGFSAREQETPVTPKYGLEYHPNDANMFYATAAEGVRGGGANPTLGPQCNAALKSLGLTSAPETFKTDTVWSYEIGAKNRLFNGRVSLDSSIYWINWTGIQQSTFLALDGCLNTITFNANAARSRGFNIDVQASLTENLLLGASLGYDDAVFTQPLSSAGALLIAVGDALPYAVPWQATASARYNFTFMDQNAFFRADADYRGAKKTNPNTDPQTALYMLGLVNDPSYTEVNARTGVAFKNGIELALYGRNLLNKHAIFMAPVDVFPTIRAGTERPRTVGVSATYRY